MFRKGHSSSLLVSLPLSIGVLGGLGTGCSHGGPLDPLDNVGGTTMMPTPPGVTTNLPDCSPTTGAPCKIGLSDLSFTEEAGCGHKGDTTLGMAWNTPNSEPGRVQFGTSETSAMQTCNNYEHKVCDMTLSAVPSLFKTLQASKIKLTFAEKHKLFLYQSTSGTTINGSAVATATLRFGGKDVLTIAGTRTGSGGNLDLAPVTAWLVPGADRSLGLRITTDCGQVFSNNLPIYWSVEGMIAEMLP